MLYLRCPDCWFASSVEGDAPRDARCTKCGANLYTYYFEGKTPAETAALAATRNEEFRARSRRNGPEAMEVAAIEKESEVVVDPPGDDRKRDSSGRKWLLAVSAVLFALIGYGYLSTKTLAIELANSLLRDSGRSQTRVTGVSIPLSIMWNNRATASLLLRPPSRQGAVPRVLNPDMQDGIRIEAEVVSSGIPIVGLAFSDVYMEIPFGQLVLVPLDRR